jgi:ABC-type phosphate/phosphonate transport system permease subunit
MPAASSDVETVQRLLGHAEATILLRTYADAIEGRGRQAVDTIEAALTSNGTRAATDWLPNWLPNSRKAVLVARDKKCKTQFQKMVLP